MLSLFHYVSFGATGRSVATSSAGTALDAAYGCNSELRYTFIRLMAVAFFTLRCTLSSGVQGMIPPCTPSFFFPHALLFVQLYDHNYSGY